jgi:hypothetical protein
VPGTQRPFSAARRARTQAAPGRGEWFGFRRTDGTEFWAIRFDAAGLVACDGPCDVELSGTASDLMLFLWNRVGAGEGSLVVRGDAALLDRYFVLVPPI